MVVLLVNYIHLKGMYYNFFSFRGFGSAFETLLHFILLSWCKMIFFNKSVHLLIVRTSASASAAAVSDADA